MKKLLILISAVAFFFGFGVCAGYSIPLTDTTLFHSYGIVGDDDILNGSSGEFVNELEGIGDWVRWTHVYDFDPEPTSILSGSLALSLRDDADWACEFGIGWGEDGTWGMGEVDTGIYEYSVNIDFLLDGRFMVTLVSLFGDFYIDKSVLSIEYLADSGHVSVPDASIMFLLGPSLIVLGIISRRKSKK